MSLESRPWQFIYKEFGVEVPPLDEKPISVYVAEHAKNIPDYPALRYFDTEVSYRELNQLANQLANVLTKLGVTRDDVVGFHMPNVPQYVLGFLAVAKVGCIGSGVSPMLAPSELAYQVSDANISVLISLDVLANKSIPAMVNTPACLKHVLVTSAADYLNTNDPATNTVELPSIEGVTCHRFTEQLSAASAEFDQANVDVEDTYLIQYTGGTTGKPKGAMLSVRNIVRCSATQYAFSQIEAGKDCSITPFPMFHIAGAGGVMSGLRYGSSMALVPDARDLDYICDQMIARPPVYFGAVPAMLQMLLAHDKFHEIDFSRLKMAVTGAAPLTSDDRRKIEAVIGEGKLCDAFGMTETSPVYIVNPPQRLKPTTLGIPVPGADVAIVDVETGTKEMPFGEAGEIITSGPHVMKGYLNLPEESAKAMREFNGKTWMYTGDVGSMDEEGYVTISDRAKDMLIVGGFKVFSVEVEDKLNDLGFVHSSAVIGVPDQVRQGNDIVNLFVQLMPDAADSNKEKLEADVIAFCRAEMSPYKVPKVIHFVDEIPLTVVGKIDKKVLRDRLNA